MDTTHFTYTEPTSNTALTLLNHHEVVIVQARKLHTRYLIDQHFDWILSYLQKWSQPTLNLLVDARPTPQKWLNYVQRRLDDVYQQYPAGTIVVVIERSFTTQIAIFVAQRRYPHLDICLFNDYAEGLLWLQERGGGHRA